MRRHWLRTTVSTIMIDLSNDMILRKALPAGLIIEPMALFKILCPGKVKKLEIALNETHKMSKNHLEKVKQLEKVLKRHRKVSKVHLRSEEALKETHKDL